MSWELEPLTYERREDACCAFCNPISMADYETTCVGVRYASGLVLYICRECLTLASRAARTGKVQTNAKVRDSIARADKLADRRR